MAPGFRAMARREEGEYSTYSTDEQRRQRVKGQARWAQNGAVEALNDRPRFEDKVALPTPLSLRERGWGEGKVLPLQPDAQVMTVRLPPSCQHGST
jgi:hypothetical protein